MGLIVGIVGTIIVINYQEQQYEHTEEEEEFIDQQHRDMTEARRQSKPNHVSNVSDLSSHRQPENDEDVRVDFKNKNVRPMVPITEATKEDYETARTFIITKEEFDSPFTMVEGDSEDEFEKQNIEYDVSNDLLMDEIGGVDIDHSITGGMILVNDFYLDETSNTMYIRNMGLSTDYEITKVDGHGNRVTKRPRRSGMGSLYEKDHPNYVGGD